MTDWTHTILKKTGCIGSYLIAAVILLFCSNASSVVSQTGHSSPNNGIQALTISSSSRAGAEAPRTETTSSRLRTSRRGNESRSRASTAPLKTLLQPSCIRIDFCVVPRWLDRFLDLIGVNVLDCRRAGAEQNPTDHIAP